MQMPSPVPFKMPSQTTAAAARDGAVPLTHWGVIRARGSDAVKFLQGQLTNDLTTLGPTQFRLAGFCSAKGRLQASFIVWTVAPDDVLLACDASVLPATLKRLSMFVLRAQCKLTDATTELSLHGVLGEHARDLLGTLPVSGRADSGAGTVLRLPDVDGAARAIVAGGSDAMRASMPAVSLDLWRLLEVRSAVPVIEAATVDRFVPQMLNYELLRGVDFGKGCYPGQEVVARSQYRGTIKRRMFLFDTEGAAQAGQEVFHGADAAQPAGMVVNAAALPGGAGSAALVEVKLASLDAGSLHLGTVDGPLLRAHPMPYEVPLDSTQSA